MMITCVNSTGSNLHLLCAAAGVGTCLSGVSPLHWHMLKHTDTDLTLLRRLAGYLFDTAGLYQQSLCTPLGWVCCALLANMLPQPCYCSDSSPILVQGHIYNHCVQQLVEGCFAGYNATVLAYGQTGSGKTHTMGTSVNAAAAEEEDYGITPRVIRSDLVLVLQS